MSNSFVIRRIFDLSTRPTRREGICERVLLTSDDSVQQNIVFVDAAEGAVVEYHRIRNSESLYILEGIFEVTTENLVHTLEPGHLCYFSPESSHGLRCVKGPGQFLAIFAPSRKQN